MQERATGAPTGGASFNEGDSIPGLARLPIVPSGKFDGGRPEGMLGFVKDFDTGTSGSFLAGEDDAAAKGETLFNQGRKSPVVYRRVESSPEPSSSAGGTPAPEHSRETDIMAEDVSMFSPAEVKAIRHLASAVVREEITGKWPPKEYRKSLRNYKEKVRALEVELEQVRKVISTNHKFAGEKYTALSDAVDELEKEDLPRRMTSLERYKELIETKYSGVPPDLARDIWNAGFKECLNAIVSRGQFQSSLTEDPSFMELVRDKDALYRAIDEEKAHWRLQRNRSRWAERNTQRRGGILPGRNVPIRPSSAGEASASGPAFRNLTEQIAAEK